jgi:hypothetical protein
VALVTDKIYYSGVSLREADFLMVQTAPVFDVKAFPSIRFARISEGGYVAESDDLQRAAAVLSQCPEVFSITAAKHPELN